MEYRKLERAGIKVSHISLGMMAYGQQNTRDEVFDQLDHAFEAGVNFINAAEMCPLPPRAETERATEEFVGVWIKYRKRRDQIVPANKVAGSGHGILIVIPMHFHACGSEPQSMVV